MRDGVSTGQHQQDDRDDEVKKLRDQLISPAVKHTTAGCPMKLWQTCIHVLPRFLLVSDDKSFPNTLTIK